MPVPTFTSADAPPGTVYGTYCHQDVTPVPEAAKAPTGVGEAVGAAVGVGVAGTGVGVGVAGRGVAVGTAVGTGVGVAGIGVAVGLTVGLIVGRHVGHV